MPNRLGSTLSTSTKLDRSSLMRESTTSHHSFLGESPSPSINTTGKMSFFSREHAMGMMKVELSKEYAFLGGCIDLDF